MCVSGFLLLAVDRQAGWLPGAWTNQQNHRTGEGERERERHGRSAQSDRYRQTVQKKVGLTDAASCSHSHTHSDTHMNIDKATTHTVATHILDMNDTGRSTRYEKSDRGFCLTLSLSLHPCRNETTRHATSSRHSLTHCTRLKELSAFQWIDRMDTEKERNNTYVRACSYSQARTDQPSDQPTAQTLPPSTHLLAWHR